MFDLIKERMDKFKNYDLNADGDPAIVSLDYLNFELSTDEIPQDARLVLVLVEPRLLNPISGSEDLDLMPRLQQFKDDLRAEGFYSRFICADVYRKQRHQDGRTLLAIRSFLREVKIVFPNFKGVVLVGAFPEAVLARRIIRAINCAGITINGDEYKDTKLLTLRAGVTVSRADIVLGDLNGNWQSLYHEGPENIEYILAIPDTATVDAAAAANKDWPLDGAEFSSTIFERGTNVLNDFFWIQDDNFAILSSPPEKLRLLIYHQLRHPEISAEDRKLPNPISRPDILVSTINALHIALNPDPAIQGIDGKKPLDASGYPQTFTSTKPYDTVKMFHRDSVLERRLLCDYFDRNHRFRIGAFANLPFRAGAIASSFSAQGDANYLGKASSKFQPPVVQEDATLLDYVKWFKQAAVLRCIHAHSTSRNTIFGDQYSVDELEQEVGGHPFRWEPTQNNASPQTFTYKPSFQVQGGRADIFVHRTMWQNHILSETGANLIIHDGCNVNTPAGTMDKPYYEEGYARFQNGEAILFYMNGVALVARAKVYNDLPKGFPDALADPRAQFGDGWKAYFDIEANDPNQSAFNQAVDCKRSYFWSMLGDWTVRLRYQNGLGILGFNPQFQSLHVHADQAWIDGWNLDTKLNSIRGIGDIDGDGIAEFVITSGWGIGILKHDGSRWRQVIIAPDDTWFGEWRYNAIVNKGKDKIQGVGNFTGGPAHEILLTSSWGIGVLGLTGTTMTSVVAQPNGTKFGEWLFDSNTNQINGFGDMKGDGLDEIVITSNWGIGVLRAKGNTFNSLIVAPNGTKFGNWPFNSLQDVIHSVADFDGDSQSELLITSDWGIGILKLQTNKLISIAIHPNGSNLNGYKLNTKTAKIAAVGKLSGDKQKCILIHDSDGLHLLQLKEGSLKQIAKLQNGKKANGWLLSKNDIFGPVGDLDGDGSEEIVVKSGWGIGILKVKGDTFSCKSLHKYGTRLEDWILDQKDHVVGIGNFTGSIGKAELLIQKGE